jgi:hypothetical protein
LKRFLCPVNLKLHKTLIMPKAGLAHPGQPVNTTSLENFFPGYFALIMAIGILYVPLVIYPDGRHLPRFKCIFLSPFMDHPYSPDYKIPGSGLE